MTKDEKIKKIEKLYNKFHLNMLNLIKKQNILLEKVADMIAKKKIDEVREKINKL